jgi:hypothetical protein
MDINHQELVYTADYDYRSGSPHLKHPELYDSLVAQLRDVIGDANRRGLPPSLLEIGAGEGSFIEPALAYGVDVSATEMSRHSIATLMERYGQNPRFSVVYDEDGSLAGLGSNRYSVILYASVLHHIRDYEAAIEAAIEDHLEPGGSFLSFQDPLWYPTLPRGTRLLSHIAIWSWSAGQGNYGRALRTLSRRLRGIYDDSEPSDTVEYHAVRNGVDHQRLMDILSTRFEKVSLITYWSTQSRIWQTIGARLGLKSTFAIRACGYKG